MTTASGEKSNVVAWLIHGQTMWTHRPKLTDFGRWSSLHRVVGSASRIQDKTACGRGVPMPHRCYRYITTVADWRKEYANVAFVSERVELCKRCFPNGEADLENCI